MNKLRATATKSPRYWNSFPAALAEVWKQNEIEDLRSRIAGRHRQMTLLLCAASKDIGRGNWKLQTDSRLDSIIQEIRGLKDRVSGHDQSRLATTDYVSSICAGFSKLSLETQIFEKEAQILATLNYSDRTARHGKIPDAHFTTFKWSLRKTEETEGKYGRLQRWLKADDALFWVFALVLSSIPDCPLGFEMARAWMSPVLSADGNNKLAAAAVTAARARRRRKDM
ncbi:hypothetical protein F5Y03DRAFT_360374 [Xylaria venustula]|nr:hypothetical protein F5Y03DRAFT_360374 [Xylaria venustula]